MATAATAAKIDKSGRNWHPLTPMASRADKRDRTSIVLGVTGSIAAYKAAEIVRLMTGKGWDVSVLMTRGAEEFITPLTLQTLSRNPVGLGLFDEKDGWHPEHISFAEKADVMLVAPCTANMLAKMAHGLADDLLSGTLLATRAPVIVAPAMNDGMWDNAATRANVAILRERGVMFADVGVGELACGRVGTGRMAEPADIVAQVAGVLAERKGKR